MIASPSLFKRYGGSLNSSLHQPKIVFPFFFLTSPQTFIQGHIGHFLNTFMETLHQKARDFDKNCQQATLYASEHKSFLKRYRKSQWPVALHESLDCTAAKMWKPHHLYSVLCKIILSSNIFSNQFTRWDPLDQFHILPKFPLLCPHLCIHLSIVPVFSLFFFFFWSCMFFGVKKSSTVFPTVPNKRGQIRNRDKFYFLWWKQDQKVLQMLSATQMP